MSNNKGRRTTLKGIAAMSVAAALPGGLISCASPRRDAQVIVIGAGLAGLNAALLLQAQGIDLLVVEGSDRIGGRVYTMMDQPHQPDAGGSEFSALSYARLTDMIDRLELKAVPWRGTGVQFSIHADGQTISAADWPTAEINRVGGPARNIPPMFLAESFLPRPSPLPTHDAWLESGAYQYDIPFGEFIKKAGADPEVIRLAGNRASSDDLDSISTLWKLHTAKFAEVSGGLDNLRGVEGGMSRVTDGMANLLSRPVQLNTQVTGISTANNQILVQTKDGRILRADYAVCTVPLTLLREIAFDPVLPALQAKAVREIPYDDHIEVFFDVLEPFWEEDGLPSSLWSDGPLGLVVHAADESPLGYLWVAITGRASAPLRALPDDQILSIATSELARMRPTTVGRLKPMAVHNWSAYGWTKGHLAYRAPGQIREFGNVAAKAHGRIHFAGEHTAVLASGMEGAMESGERAALEILDRTG